SDAQSQRAYVGEHVQRIFAEDEQLALGRAAGGARGGERTLIGHDSVAASELAERRRQVTEGSCRPLRVRVVQALPPRCHINAERGSAPGRVLLPDVLWSSGRQRREEVEDDRGEGHALIVGGLSMTLTSQPCGFPRSSLDRA